MDGPYGLKSIIRSNLLREGIDFDDLKPGCVRHGGDASSTIASVEIMMAIKGISVEELKKGTIYQYNEEDRKKIIDDEEQKILSMINDMKNKEAKKKMKMKKKEDDEEEEEARSVLRSLDIYGGCYSYEEYVELCAIPRDDPYGFQKAMANRRRLYGLDKIKDPNEEGMVFDSIGRPIPVHNPNSKPIHKFDCAAEVVKAIANYQKQHKTKLDSDGRPILEQSKAIPEDDDDENNQDNNMMKKKKMRKGPEALQGEASYNPSKDDPFQYQKIMDKGKKPLIIDCQEEEDDVAKLA